MNAPCRECIKTVERVYWKMVVSNDEKESRMKIKTKLINTTDQQFIPTRKYPKDAGADLRARIDQSIVLHPEKSVKIPTGIAVEIPEGYVGDVRPRSGAAVEGKLTISGTIDSNYRGEISLNVLNVSDKTLTIEPGERLAQLVILPYLSTDFEQVDELTESDRGVNGFGSTGKY